jgi:ubiquitin carboxyl-terminal hydrolase 36/42
MDTGDVRYQLYGVLVHMDSGGSTSCGHYVAYVRLPDGTWHLCDDARVGQVCAAAVVAPLLHA